MAITSGIVRTRLNIPEVTLKRKAWNYRRTGAEISAGRPKGAPGTQGVTLLPGGGWSLAPYAGSLTGLLTNPYADAEISAEDIDFAPGVVTESVFHTSDLPGIGTGEDTREAAQSMFRKTVAADQDWAAQVETASAEALPSPAIISPTGVPMDRLGGGKVTYPPNSGFSLTFGGISDVVGKGPICTLLFGGNTAIRPLFGKADSTGGRFAITFSQDGSAVLHERDELNGAEEPQDYWEVRGSFQWGDANTAENRFVSFLIVPYGHDRVALIAPKFAAGIAPTARALLLPQGLPVGMPPANRGMAPGIYIERPQDSAHEHLETMTGAGPLYLDSRRDVRGLYGLARVMYPETGVLVDEPFEIAGPTGPDNPLWVKLDTYILPNGGGASVTVHDATTHAALETDADGNFLTVVGQSFYYVKIGLTSSEDRFHSPIVWGYTAGVPGQFHTRNPTPTVGGNIRSVGIMGPSTDCTTESAGVEFKDPSNQLGGMLQYHDGFRADIVVVNPNTGAVVSRLFEGVVAKPDFRYRSNGQTTREAWYDYPRLRMLGLSTRLAEQVPLGFPTFSHDRSLPEQPHGKTVPWKVADTIRYLLNDCGVPDDEIDIPAYYGTIRLWPPGTKNFELYQLHPGGDQANLRLLQKLCRDYLGAILLRDPNAGARGMWRLLTNPTVNSPVRAEFVKVRPGGTQGMLGTSAAVYGAGRAFWQDGTFFETIQRPEINYLYICGSADHDDKGAPSRRVKQEFYNWTSHEFYDGQPIPANPAHPDYLGRPICAYVIDPLLMGQGAVDFVGKRIYDQAAHAEKYVRFRAPLLTIVAPDDPYQSLPRPLRINDLVRVQGPSGVYHLAVMKSCNPSWQGSDGLRMADYECKYLS